MWNDIKKIRPKKKEYVIIWCKTNKETSFTLAQYCDTVVFYYHNPGSQVREKTIIPYQFKLFCSQGKDIYLSEKSVLYWCELSNFFAANVDLLKASMLGYQDMGIVLPEEDRHDPVRIAVYAQLIKYQKEIKRKKYNRNANIDKHHDADTKSAPLYK